MPQVFVRAQRHQAAHRSVGQWAVPPPARLALRGQRGQIAPYQVKGYCNLGGDEVNIVNYKAAKGFIRVLFWCVAHSRGGHRRAFLHQMIRVPYFSMAFSFKVSPRPGLEESLMTPHKAWQDRKT